MTIVFKALVTRNDPHGIDQWASVILTCRRILSIAYNYITPFDVNTPSASAQGIHELMQIKCQLCECAYGTIGTADHGSRYKTESCVSCSPIVNLYRKNTFLFSASLFSVVTKTCEKLRFGNGSTDPLLVKTPDTKFRSDARLQA